MTPPHTAPSESYHTEPIRTNPPGHSQSHSVNRWQLQPFEPISPSPSPSNTNNHADTDGGYEYGEGLGEGDDNDSNGRSRSSTQSSILPVNDSFIASLHAEFGNLNNLKLHNNGLASLPSLRPFSLSLLSLDLSNNQLTHRCLTSLTNLTALRVLSLPFNRLQSLIGMPMLPSLITFHLHGNYIEIHDGQAVIETIEVCCPSLQLLTLHSNPMSVDDAGYRTLVCEGLKSLRQFQWLDDWPIVETGTGTNNDASNADDNDNDSMERKYESPTRSQRATPTPLKREKPITCPSQSQPYYHHRQQQQRQSPSSSQPLSETAPSPRPSENSLALATRVNELEALLREKDQQMSEKDALLTREASQNNQLRSYVQSLLTQPARPSAPLSQTSENARASDRSVQEAELHLLHTELSAQNEIIALQERALSKSLHCATDGLALWRQTMKSLLTQHKFDQTRIEQLTGEISDRDVVREESRADELREWRASYHSLREQYQASQSQLTELQQQWSVSQQSHQVLKGEHERQSQEFLTLKETVTTTLGALDSAWQSLATAAERLRGHEQRLDFARNRIQLLAQVRTAQQYTITGDHSRANNDIHTLTETAALQPQCKPSSIALAQSQSQDPSSLALEFESSLQRELQRSHDDRQLLLKHRDDVILSLTTAHQARVAELNQTLQTAQATVAALTTENHSLTQSLTVANGKIASSEQSIVEQLETQRQTLEAEMLDKCQRYQTQLQALQSDYDNLKKDWITLQLEHRTLQRRHSTMVEEKQSVSAREAETTRKLFASQLASREAAIGVLQTQVEALNQALKRAIPTPTFATSSPLPSLALSQYHSLSSSQTSTQSMPAPSVRPPVMTEQLASKLSSLAALSASLLEVDDDDEDDDEDG